MEGKSSPRDGSASPEDTGRSNLAQGPPLHSLCGTSRLCAFLMGGFDLGPQCSGLAYRI